MAFDPKPYGDQSLRIVGHDVKLGVGVLNVNEAFFTKRFSPCPDAKRDA